MKLNNIEFIVLKNMIKTFEKYDIAYNNETLTTCIDVFIDGIEYANFDNIESQIDDFVCDAIEQNILNKKPNDEKSILMNEIDMMLNKNGIIKTYDERVKICEHIILTRVNVDENYSVDEYFDIFLKN